MRTVELIQKKRDGGTLTREEIHFLVDGYVRGEIPDYQMAAWAMSVYFQGMTAEETANLTLEMAASGDRIDLSAISGMKVDKHSTGGVGDKTTIVLAPLVASAGVPVAKMSGRGLGHTGGTIDKLEAIPGFTVELTKERFLEQVKQIGVSVISQSGNIAPADKKLYALRDVTATVNSIPLIASSIMSKKIASGADAIVLDVKTGSGAFMKTLEDAIALAKAMVDIGVQVGRETVAVISDMDQPLGFAIGNALEIEEAVKTLQGQGPSDLQELCLVLGAYMLVCGGAAASYEEARTLLTGCLQDGRALKKLQQLAAAQGGNAQALEQTELLPQAARRIDVPAPASGFIHAIQAEQIGIAAMRLGAGRATKEAKIDLSVGVVLKRKAGEAVREQEPLAVLHASEHADPQLITDTIDFIRQAFLIKPDKPEPQSFIHAVVTKDGVQSWQF